MNLEDAKNEIFEIKKQMQSQRRLLRLSLMGWAALTSSIFLGAAYRQSAAPFFPELRVGRLALVDANGVERLLLIADSTTANANHE